MTKFQEKNKAIDMRRNGMSIKDIAKSIGVAKSSVSVWVRDVSLSQSTQTLLKNKSHSRFSIEKRRASRLINEENKRQIIINSAEKSITNVSKRELWLIGVMLYWAEGGKTQRMVRFSNGDSNMIKIMMSFFRIVCNVPESKFRGYIHIHPHLDHEEAEKYWSEVTGIPIKQFFKTYRKHNVSSKNTRNSLPYGVMDIYVMDTKLFLTISGWAKGVFNKT